jgi:hypothetical protein
MRPERRQLIRRDIFGTARGSGSLQDTTTCARWIQAVRMPKIAQTIRQTMIAAAMVDPRAGSGESACPSGESRAYGAPAFGRPAARRRRYAEEVGL